MSLVFGAFIEVDPPVEGRTSQGDHCTITTLVVIDHKDDGTIRAISGEEGKTCIVALRPGPDKRTITVLPEARYESKK